MRLQKVNNFVQSTGPYLDFDGVFAFNLHRFFPIIDALNRARDLDTGGHFLFYQGARYLFGDSVRRKGCRNHDNLGCGLAQAKPRSTS